MAGEAGRGRGMRPIDAWALAIGGIIGFGAFIMPADAFLPQAGPLGTAIAVCLGLLIMGVIALNFGTMVVRLPAAGGPYAFTRDIFGRGHAFVCAWFLVLSYCAVVPQNATALAVMVRDLVGPQFQVGLHYRLAGYDVYLGEALLADLPLLFCAYLNVRHPRLVFRLQTVLACLLVASVGVAMFALLRMPGGLVRAFNPAFPSGVPAARGVLSILAVMPWAFVGFEAISQTSEDHAFDQRLAFPIMLVAIVMGAIIYVSLTLITAAVVPDGYASWEAYIQAASSLEGLAALPTFNAGRTLLGETGVIVLGIAAFCAIMTGVNGLFAAALRLVQAMAYDRSVPRALGVISPRYGVPVNAINLILVITLVVPFLGRTVLGWIMDMSSVGTAAAYSYTSACAYRLGKREGNVTMQLSGVLGMVFSQVFILLLLLPIPGLNTVLGRESLVFLVMWMALGVNFYTPLTSADEASAEQGAADANA